MSLFTPGAPGAGNNSPARRRLFALATASAAAAAGGTVLLTLAPAARADGTQAGVAISNTATATYNDPNNPSQTLNTASNTVSMTVAEVAGLSVAPLAITDTTPATPILPGDVIQYDFKITNVGNDPTRFVIPGTTNVTGPGTAGTLKISTDDGATYSDVPTGGLSTAAIAANASVRVRVPVTVNGTAPSGAPIAVLLGNTGANDNGPATQNQPYPTAPAGADLYSSDNPDGGAPAEAAGTPANGEREGSARQQILVGAQPQAFAAVLLSRAGYADNGTPGVLNDDTLTYGLTLRVDATAPGGAPTSLVPADLAATPITVDGIPVSRVLVSSAVPAGTVLAAVPPAPSGWQAVYTTTPTATDALNTAWSLTPPGSLAAVTRIGWVAAGPVAKGSTISGFSFAVTTQNVAPTGSTTIAGIAQLFGQTAGDATSALVYDESGDQAPSNFNDNGSPGSTVPTNGVANPATDGVDPGDNAGSGPGGEAFPFTVAVPGTVLSGPSGQPGAVGPTDNNDDFSNQAAPVPAGMVPGATYNPAPLGFTGTIQNPGGVTISNLLLVPFAPPNPADLPAGTTVTLVFGGNTAVYTYNGTIFQFSSGSAIQIPNLNPGVSVNYSATIDLPAGTPLSTDIGRGFSIPIRAFADADRSGTYDPGESANTTIDRVYTGFLRLVKEVRILDADGTTEVQGFSQAPITAQIRPGRFIEWRITYTNISTTPAGSGNTVLNAGSIVITEDGTSLPNNWALDQDASGMIDTSNVVGSATDSGTAVISFFAGPSGGVSSPDQSGTTAPADVTKYVNSVSGNVAPGASRTFRFRRRIN